MKQDNSEIHILGVVQNTTAQKRQEKKDIV